jgi:hypothetical protein
LTLSGTDRTIRRDRPPILPAPRHKPKSRRSSFPREPRRCDGAYQESAGSGTARLQEGTLLDTDAATHWISGSFRAAYRGEAGSGEASGSIERCYYFK